MVFKTIFKRQDGKIQLFYSFEKLWGVADGTVCDLDGDNDIDVIIPSDGGEVCIIFYNGFSDSDSLVGKEIFFRTVIYGDSSSWIYGDFEKVEVIAP